MARQPIFPGYQEWTIDPGSDLTRPEGPGMADPDEGPLFVGHGRNVWARLLETGDDPPSATLAEHLRGESFVVGRWDRVAEYSLDCKASRLAGRAFLVPEIDRPHLGHWALHGFTAAHGIVAEITFYFADRDDAAWAIEAWRSVEYAPYHLSRVCADSGAPLSELCRTLERGWGFDGPLRELRRQGYAEAAVTLVRAGLRDERSYVREGACLAMERLQGQSASLFRADLRAVLSDSEDLVRVRAADALWTLGEPADTLVPHLIEIVQRSDPAGIPLGRERVVPPCGYLAMPEARCLAARILGDLGAATEPARLALRAALTSGSGMVRAAAARSLAGLGEPVATYFGPLRDAMIDGATQSSRERVEAAEALLDLGEPPAPVVPTLVELVVEPDWTAHVDAMRILKRLGPAAAGAEPVLRAALDHSDAALRRRVREVLRAVAPAARSTQRPTRRGRKQVPPSET